MKKKIAVFFTPEIENVPAAVISVGQRKGEIKRHHEIFFIITPDCVF